jgi:hypothetical protein
VIRLGIRVSAFLRPVRRTHLTEAAPGRGLCFEPSSDAGRRLGKLGSPDKRGLSALARYVSAGMHFSAQYAEVTRTLSVSRPAVSFASAQRQHRSGIKHEPHWSCSEQGDTPPTHCGWIGAAPPNPRTATEYHHE